MLLQPANIEVSVLTNGVATYRQAVQNGCQWLTSLQREDGSYGRDTRSLEAYYKSPLAFAETGRLTQGVRTLSWLEHRFLTGFGHFADAYPPRYERHCDLYQDLWLIWGAFRLGRTDVVKRTLNYVMRFFDPSSGGFQGLVHESASTATRDLRSTALGGIVNLFVGEVAAAEAAADFVMAILDLQPDLSQGFYLVRKSNGELAREFPQELERFFIVLRNQTNPLYYALGLAVAFLANLSHKTGERKYLFGAQRYAEVCEAFGEDILRHHYGGKLGWGLAVLHRITREVKYARRAIVVADHLTRLQLPSGEWSLPTLYPDFCSQPLSVTIDRTSEFIVWLTYIADELSDLSSTYWTDE